MISYYFKKIYLLKIKKANKIIRLKMHIFLWAL